jgi:hypothetical protein
LVQDRSSGSSFGTRSTTPSTQRTSSSFGVHSSSNASLRSSTTSFLSASNTISTQYVHVSSPDDFCGSPFISKLPSQLNENDAFTTMASTDAIPDSWTPTTTGDISATIDPASVRLTWRCIYAGHEKFTIARKGDWVRHMDKYHKPGLEAWDCSIRGCGRLFETEPLFRQHHALSHHCRRNCTHADQSRTPATRKLAYACGFIGCSSLFSDWTPWRDHVRDHLLSGTSIELWKHTVELRNLLRRREISALWEYHVMQQLGATEGYQPMFQWEPHSTAHLKRHLEYSDLRTDPQKLVTLIFEAAISVTSQTNSPSMPLTDIDPTFASSDLIADPTNLSEYNANFAPSAPYLDRASSQQAAANTISYDWDQQTPFYQPANHENNLDCANNFGHNVTDFDPNNYNPSLIDTEPKDEHASHTSVEPHRPEPISQRAPDFWYPKVPSTFPNEPVATYGLPAHATSSPTNTTKADPQCNRTKSSGTNSLTKKLSSIFSRKSMHSRSESDNSDRQMGGV